MTIGEKIKSFRSLKQLTQKALAENSGVSESAIKKYESGERIPKQTQLKKIAQALDISESIFKINTTELTTVGDAMALFFLLNQKVGIIPKYDTDKDGNIDPTTIKLQFENMSVNTHLAEWLSDKLIESYDLDLLNQKLCRGKLSQDDYDLLFHASKGIIELTEQSCIEDKELLDKKD